MKRYCLSVMALITLYVSTRTRYMFHIGLSLLTLFFNFLIVFKTLQYLIYKGKVVRYVASFRKTIKSLYDNYVSKRISKV